jgi:hypothetical protein
MPFRTRGFFVLYQFEGMIFEERFSTLLPKNQFTYEYATPG